MNQTNSQHSLQVSIITPIHNVADFLGDMLESVLAQTFDQWELILVDDLSTDNSVEIAQSFIAKDQRIKLIELTQNSGSAVARNSGIEAAMGRFIAFLDSDDTWLPTKLEKQIAFMLASGHVFTYTAYEKINTKGQFVGKVGVPDRVSYRDMLKTCYIGCLTVIYDTTYFGKQEMPLIRRRQDYGLWLSLLKKVDYAYGLPEVLGQYRVHDKSISANKLVTATYTWRLYRQIEKLSFLKSCYFFAHYAVRGFFRNRLPGLARAIGLLN